MRKGAGVVGALVGLAGLVEDAAELLVVVGQRPGADADRPGLVVGLPQGTVEVPDGFVVLETGEERDQTAGARLGFAAP